MKAGRMFAKAISGDAEVNAKAQAGSQSAVGSQAFDLAATEGQSTLISCGSVSNPSRLAEISIGNPNALWFHGPVSSRAADR
jgi:hypothetical protein